MRLLKVRGDGRQTEDRGDDEEHAALPTRPIPQTTRRRGCPYCRGASSAARIRAVTDMRAICKAQLTSTSGRGVRE